ncbi:MAG: hypothetical protein EOM53_02885 [Alphaproteobacteria bacterium]|nr:hypothetical protein [Alphaproteobacteria bacterium]
MFYWIYLLTFVLSILVYGLYPRTDKLALDNFELAKASVSEFLIQHESLRQLVQKDKKPTFTQTLKCLNTFCSSEKEDTGPTAIPPASITKIKRFCDASETTTNSTGDGNLITYIYPCNEDTTACRTRVETDLDDLDPPPCANKSYYAAKIEGVIHPAKLIPTGDFINPLTANLDMPDNGPVGIVKKSAILQLTPPGFRGNAIDDSSTAVLDDEHFQSMIMCINNKTGRAALSGSSPVCQQEYVNADNPGTTDFLITYGPLPDYWEKKPEYHALWKKALSAMTGKTLDCGFLAEADTAETSVFTKYQRGTKYIIRTPFGEAIRLPCRFTRFLTDAKIQSQQYVVCIQRLFSTRNPSAVAQMDENGNKRYPDEPISTDYCSN